MKYVPKNSTCCYPVNEICTTKKSTQRILHVCAWIKFYLPLRSVVKYQVEHEKIKSVSTSRHVTFCLLYKKQYLGDFSSFPKISGHFPNVSEDFRKLSENCPKLIRAFPIIFRKFQKISEDYRRLSNISEQSSKMFRSYRNKFRFVQHYKFGKFDSTYDVIDIFNRNGTSLPEGFTVRTHIGMKTLVNLDTTIICGKTTKMSVISRYS